MHELWHGSPHWSEEQEQAKEDSYALRVITCPRKACRRTRRCAAAPGAKRRCPGIVPWTDEERAKYRAVALVALRRRVAEDEGDPETARIAQQARDAAQARRRAAAWERARALMRGRVAEGLI